MDIKKFSAKLSKNVNTPKTENLVRELKDTTAVLIKNYLFSLYHDKSFSPNFRVVRFLGYINHHHPMLKAPFVIYNENLGVYRFDDMYLFVTLKIFNQDYEITFKTSFVELARTNRIQERNHMYISSPEGRNADVEEIFKYLKEHAIKKSNLVNKILEFNSYKQDDSDVLSCLRSIKLPKTSLKDVFIPDKKKHHIERFIYEVNNYSCVKKNSIRLLLAGNPGTGKTNLVNAIITETFGKATVILCNGTDFPIDPIFKFCELFEPVILVIDDLDFVVGDRANSVSNDTLSKFLTLLDGVVPRKIFLLATSTKKRVIDTAASRPGRFSVILDIAEIEPQNYLQLVKRETDDKKIIAFFNEKTLSEFKTKKVTGALLVNLIKQLESCKRMKGEITDDDFKDYFEMLYNGFYNSNSEDKVNGFGFNA
jgi:chromosomal replication initiation ATPase DnaA